MVPKRAASDGADKGVLYMPGKRPTRRQQRRDPDKPYQGVIGEAADRAGWSGLAKAGAILGALALLFAPIFLGPAGVICGAIAWGQGDEKGGPWAIAISLTGLVLGWIIGAVVWGAVTGGTGG